MKSQKLHLWLIRFVGLLVPQRLRADWRQEWEAELHHREALLAQWDKLDGKHKLDLLRRSTSAFWDAWWLLPKRWEDEMIQDIRLAVRMLRKAPGYTAVAVLALGLGIGVNTAILSAVNGFVLRPLPVERPAELVALHWGGKKEAQVWGKFSYANYEDLHAQNKSFADLCAWIGVAAGISAGDERHAGDSARAEVGWGELVSHNYFDVMGVRPRLGRGFLPEEGRTANTHPVVVLGHELWQRRFRADTGIIGKTIALNGQPFTVVGVMPESFLGAEFYLRKSFWVPLQMAQQLGRRADWQTERSYAFLMLYGRLKDGVTMAQAETDVQLVAENLAQLHPRINADSKIRLVTEVDGRYQYATKVIRFGGLLAVGISALVLLLACANVANLMLARSATRVREIGIRLALGAGRGRIVRQLLTESVLLACLGGGLGWGLAYWGARVIHATVPPVPYPITFDFAPDGYVLRWMLAVSLATGIIFGLAPALLAARTDLVAVIKGAVAGATRRRRWNLRSALVVAQITISLVVLICAGLFIRSLSQAIKTDPGFKTENLVMMMVRPGLLAYDHQASLRFYRELQRRIETQPGVRRAALATELPLLDSRPERGPIVKEGELDPPPNQGVKSECSFITPNYFDTVQTQLVLGRDFTERDDADAPPVVIVNQEFARRFYGSEQQALGKRFRFAAGTPLMEIIGIARNGYYATLYEDPQTYLFLPVYQHPQTAMALLISTSSAAAIPPVLERAQQTIAQLDARLPIGGRMLAEENLSLAYWGPRVAAGMATTFGVLALVLATLGLYSVMTYAVSQRTREIGIRMALGAQVRDVLRLVISQGLRLVLVGLALGLVGAVALTRVLASLLLGVGATDPLTFVGVALLLVGIAFIACYLPARRAARVDPLVSLRQE